MKNSTSFCKRGYLSAPVYIQFIRGVRLLGLEVRKATRLLEKIVASDEGVAVRLNASLLLSGIRQGREIFDERPLISEFGKREQSTPIYIHDVVWCEIANAIEAAYRAKGGYDD
jgi:hypothetical protein